MSKELVKSVYPTLRDEPYQSPCFLLDKWWSSYEHSSMVICLRCGKTEYRECRTNGMFSYSEKSTFVGYIDIANEEALK